LEGLTQDEAACRLGWSKSTCRRNLGRGRELLGARLARRGVTLSAALLAPLLSESAAAAPPAALIAATARAAARAAAAARGAHAEEAANPMFGGRRRGVRAPMLAGGIAAGAGVLAPRAAAARQPAPQQKDDRAGTDRPRVGAAQAVKVRGRVLGPDGEP